MKRNEHRVLVAGLLAVALAACANTGMRGDSGIASRTDSDYGTPPDSGSRTGATGASGSAGATASGADSTSASSASSASQDSMSAGSGADQASQAGMAASTPNSTVTNIEIVPRQSVTGAGTGTGAIGSSGAAGSTGSSMGSDRVYRITLRMDDGTVRSITQEATPSFSTGDRVRLSSGAIVR